MVLSCVGSDEKIFIAYYSGTLSNAAAADYDFSPAEDKLKHLGVSAAVGFGANYVISDWRKAFGACTAVGIVKEIYDESDYGGGSVEDIAYDLVGCAIGVGVSQSFGIKMAFIPERDLDGMMVAVHYAF